MNEHYKVKLANVSKNYGSLTALKPTDLNVKNGEFVTLLGPSGSGKTTILNLISGMTSADTGKILIDGQDMTQLSPSKRGLGMVFQHYALMPHMTVFENIAFPLRVRKVPNAEIKTRVTEALETIRLPQVASRKPSELSGGQQQRIAIARCLVYKPSIILMDEPLGALDKKLREEMQLELKRLHREVNITALYVTHDQEEALTMSDRIVLMNKGGIEQMGTPNELYFSPNTVFSATFLGDSNLFRGQFNSESGVAVINTPIGSIRSTYKNPGLVNGQKAVVMVRPESIAINIENVSPSGNVISGELIDSISFGGVVKNYVRLKDGTTMISQELTSSNRSVPPKGTQVSLSWQYHDTVLLRPDDSEDIQPFKQAAE